MVNNSLSIVWDNEAKQQLQKAYLYIRKDSYQNAEKVKLSIVDSVKNLLANPEIHTPDKYKTNNDNNYRAFELYHYKISYYVGKSEIRILRIRHTSMKPLAY